jgi:Lrp/AsnC family transcriptional regulator for asnA, asnC and gidA
MSNEDSKILIFLRELFTTYASYFVEIQFLKSIGSYALHEKYLYNEQINEYTHQSFLDPSPKIDETDKKILNLISKDARMNFTEIGAELKMTPEAILQRYKKLKENISVIKPRIDHSKLGLGYYHLWLRVSEGKLVKEIIDYCLQDNNCVFIMEHVGKYHLHIEIVCEDDCIDKYQSDLMDKFDKCILEYDLCKIASEIKILINS